MSITTTPSAQERGLFSSGAARWWRFGFLVLAAATCALILIRPPTDRFADLHVYLGATQQVANGLPLNDFRAENGDPLTCPPFALLAALAALVALTRIWLRPASPVGAIAQVTGGLTPCPSGVDASRECVFVPRRWLHG